MSSKRPTKPTKRTVRITGKTARHAARTRAKDSARSRKRSDVRVTKRGSAAGTPVRSAATGRFVNGQARAGAAPRGSRPAFVVVDNGVTITGSPRALEDHLDGREIERRHADPENQGRIPWSELKAKRGL